MQLLLQYFQRYGKKEETVALRCIALTFQLRCFALLRKKSPLFHLKKSTVTVMVIFLCVIVSHTSRRQLPVFCLSLIIQSSGGGGGGASASDLNLNSIMTLSMPSFNSKQLFSNVIIIVVIKAVLLVTVTSSSTSILCILLLLFIFNFNFILLLLLAFYALLTPPPIYLSTTREER